MSSANISLTDEMMAFIGVQVAQGGYISASDYLRAIIRDAQKRQAKQELEDKLLEGLEGPATEMTREDWESIGREAVDGLAGEAIRP